MEHVTAILATKRHLTKHPVIMSCQWHVPPTLTVLHTSTTLSVPVVCASVPLATLLTAVTHNVYPVSRTSFIY